MLALVHSLQTYNIKVIIIPIMHPYNFRPQTKGIKLMILQSCKRHRCNIRVMKIETGYKEKNAKIK